MLKPLTLITFMAATATAAATAPSLSDLADIIDNHSCLKGHVIYEVLLPTSPDPVVYEIDLSSLGTHADTLSPCEYLIDWSLQRPGGVTKGFSAYYSGNHFRYRDTKLQEYHLADDPTPFAGQRGVQRQAQFVDLLGPFVAAKLRSMATDSSYIYTVKEDSKILTVTGVETVKGYEALQFTYEFSLPDYLPLRFDFVYNPASISEQSVTAKYSWQKDAECLELTEETLSTMYADVFASFRQSNFHVLNLVGKPLPSIMALDDKRGRFVHNRGESLGTPTLLVFLDAQVAGTEGTIAAVRQGLENSPVNANVIYIMKETQPDHTPAPLSTLQPSETLIPSARNAVADCGITAFPTIIFCNSDSSVADTQIGANNNLAELVLQKTTLLR